MSKSQFGFRKGRGIRDSISIFLMNVYIYSFYRKEIFGGLFFGCKGCIRQHQLDHFEEKCEEVDYSFYWIFNIISTREFFVKFHDSVEGPKITSKGISQGFVLSPLQYAIYTNSLESAADSPYSILQYIDDVVIFSVEVDLNWLFIDHILPPYAD